MLKVKFKVMKRISGYENYKNYPVDNDPLDLVKDVEYEFQDVDEIDWNDPVMSGYYAGMVAQRYRAKVLGRYENGKLLDIQEH